MEAVDFVEEGEALVLASQPLVLAFVDRAFEACAELVQLGLQARLDSRLVARRLVRHGQRASRERVVDFVQALHGGRLGGDGVGKASVLGVRVDQVPVQAVDLGLEFGGVGGRARAFALMQLGGQVPVVGLGGVELAAQAVDLGAQVDLGSGVSDAT